MNRRAFLVHKRDTDSLLAGRSSLAPDQKTGDLKILKWSGPKPLVEGSPFEDRREMTDAIKEGSTCCPLRYRVLPGSPRSLCMNLYYGFPSATM